MFKNWQVIFGMVGFVGLVGLCIWSFGKLQDWRDARHMRRFNARKAEDDQFEVIPISPGFSAIRVRPEGENIISHQPALSEQGTECEASQLPQIGDSIFFTALRGRSKKHYLRSAKVESVRPIRNSFVLRWQDSLGRWHRRSMTLPMLRHRQALILR